MVRKMSQLFAVAVGMGCVGIISYCVYFDQKRRADPGYKQKIRNRRKMAALLSSKMPDVIGAPKVAAVQVPTLDEENISELVYAVLETEDPRQIMQFIYCSMPRSVFDEVVKRAWPLLHVKHELRQIR